MKPTKIRVKNFRSYESTDWLSFEEKITIVGENNAGKSNLLDAFNKFFSFGSHTGHNQSDFHHGQIEEPVEIDVCFTNLGNEVSNSFGDNIFDRSLIVKAELPYDEELDKADTKQYYGQKEVLQHDELRDIGSVDPEDAVEIYYEHDELLEPFKTDEVWSGENRASVERVVEQYANSGEAEVEKVWKPLSKKKLRTHMPEFSYFPADRSLSDATRTSNKSSLLSQLLRSAVDEISESQTNEIEQSLHSIQEQLNGEDKFVPIQELEANISEKLSMQIRDIENISIKTDVPDLDRILTRNVDVHINDANESLIDDIGSGSQMSFVLACLWELSERDTDSIVFALEEPENDLHPHAQRQLYKTLNELTEKGHTVLLSTHSPELVTLDDISNIARIEKQDDVSKISSASDDLFSSIQRRKLQTLMTTDKNEMFFSRGVLLCEGPSERQTIPILNETLSNHNDDIDLFDARGVSLVDVGGKGNMSMFAKLADEFNIPSITILDDDRGDESGDNQNNEKHEEIMDDLEDLSTEFIHLEEDLEFALFKCLSVAEFCESMNIVCSFDTAADDIQTAIEKSGQPKEVVFKRQFDTHEPSKPQFGRAAVNRIEEDRVPEKVSQAIRRSLQITA